MIIIYPAELADDILVMYAGRAVVACHLSDERRVHILDDEIRPKL
jgi:hypothetical protein